VLSSRSLCFTTTRLTESIFTRDPSIGIIHSSSAPSLTRIADSTAVFDRTSSNSSPIFLSASTPAFLSPAIKTISTPAFSSVDFNCSHSLIASNIAFTSESSGSASANFVAADRLASLPIIGVFNPAFSPMSLSLSTQITSVLISDPTVLFIFYKFHFSL